MSLLVVRRVILSRPTPSSRLRMKNWNPNIWLPTVTAIITTATADNDNNRADVDDDVRTESVVAVVVTGRDGNC